MDAIDGVLEDLWSSSDRQIISTGLAGVRRRCSSEYGAHQVLELVGGRGSQKLLELWDLHAKGRGARVKAELYLFIMALVDLRRYAQNPGSHDLFGSIRTAGFKIVDKRIEGILQTLKYGSIRDANAAFCLLAALAGLGEGFVNRIIYGMKTSSLKLSFGKITSRSSEDVEQSYRFIKEHLSMNLDRLHTISSRACFILMAVSMLKNCHLFSYSSLLSVKNFVSTLLSRLNLDPPEVVNDVVPTLSRMLLVKTFPVDSRIRSCLHTPRHLRQLSNLCKYTQERGAGDQAANLLLVLCLDSRYGLLPPKEPSAEDQVWRYKQMMELLCYLQPHAHLKHWLLVGHICAAWPKLAEEYVISTGIGTLCMDDSLAITKLGVIIKLLRIAVKSISGFLREARLHKMSTEDAQALAVKINQWCGQLLPTKDVLLKLLQTEDSCTSYCTLLYISQVLCSMEEVLLLGRTLLGSNFLGCELKMTLFSKLPSQCTLMRMLWLHSRGNGISGAIPVACSTKRLLFLESIASILEMYWRFLPELMPKENACALMKVLNKDAMHLYPASQLKIISAVKAAGIYCGRAFIYTWLPEKLPLIMKLLTESKSVDVKSGAECLLMGWLDALGLSKGDLGCFMTYANLVPPYGSGVIAQKQHSVIISFLCDVLKSAIKSPHSLHEIRDELPGNKVLNHEVCLLNVALLSLCLQTISSPTKNSEEKVWLSGYVSNALAMHILTSDFPLPLVVLVSTVLEKAMSSLRESNIGMTARKPLPVEASSIQSLWLMCAKFVRHIAAENPSLFGHWTSQWLEQGTSSDAALERYITLSCPIVSSTDEPDLKSVHNTLDELLHYLKLPVEPLKVERSMSSLLLKSSRDKALEFLLNITSKHPNWLMNEGIALAFQQVMKGHCLGEGLNKYVAGVINGGGDLNRSCSFFPLLRAALWSRELHKSGATVDWLEAKLNDLPLYWRPQAVSFIICCLSSVGPSKTSHWRFGFGLLEALLVSTSALYPESATSILRLIFEHKILTFTLLQDETGSIATLSIDLGQSMVQQKGMLPNSICAAINSPSSFLQKIADRFPVESSFWEVKFLGVFSRIAHFVKDPLRQTVLNVVKAGLSKTQHTPLYILKVLRAFSLRYVDGSVQVDWQFQALLLQLPSSEYNEIEHLSGNMVMTTPFHLGVHCGVNWLSSIVKFCMSSAAADKQLLLRDFLKLEPLCRAVFERELAVSILSMEETNKLLPSALEYLVSLRKDQVPENSVCELFFSRTIKGFSAVRQNQAYCNLEASGIEMLSKYGISFVMHYCHRGEMHESIWSTIMEAILPESSWLQQHKAIREGLMTLGAYMINRYVRKVTVSSGIVIDKLCHFVCITSSMIANLAQESASTNVNATELHRVQQCLLSVSEYTLSSLLKELEVHQLFQKVLQEIQNLAIEVMKHHLRDPENVHFVRSLLAMFIGKKSSSPRATNNRSARERKPFVAAGAVAREILNAVLDHSCFQNALVPEETPQAECVSETIGLSWPLESFLPVFDPVDEKPRSKIMTCSSLRLELLLLIQTLLDIEMSSQMIFNLNDEQAVKECNLMALLIRGYGATLQQEDVTSLRIVEALDRRIFSKSNPDSDYVGVLSLRRIGYIWGAAAKYLHTRNMLVPLILGPTKSYACAVSPHPPDYAIQLIKERMPFVDHQCCAMALMYFPEDRHFNLLRMSRGAGSNFGESSVHVVYDPIYLLPFCQSVLGVGWMGPMEFWYSGLLGLCLRASAAKDRDCRKVARQVIVSFHHTLSFHCLSDGVALLWKLIEVYLLAVDDSFPRLSSITAVFLAEASLQIAGKQTHLHVLIQIILQKALETKCTGLSLFTGFLSSAEPWNGQKWILEILMAGMASLETSNELMEQNLIPSLMSLHDSVTSDGHTEITVLLTILKATEVPDIGIQLLKSTGLVAWLGDRAIQYGWNHTHGHSPCLHQNLDTMCNVVKSLRHLLCGSNVKNTESRGVLEEHMRVSGILCQIITQYFDGTEVGKLWKTGHGCTIDLANQIAQGDAGYTKGALEYITPCYAQSHAWWEVVLYLTDVLRTRCARGKPSGVCVLSWKSLRSLLSQADQVKAWLNIPLETIMNCLVEMQLMMSPVEHNDCVHEADIEHWSDIASRGISNICHAKQAQTLHSPREIAKQLGEDCHPKISQMGRIIMWLAAWFSHGCPIPSHWQTGAVMTAIVKAHKSASQEEQMSTIVGVLICILKLSSIDITKLQLEVGNLSTTRISSAVAQLMKEISYSSRALSTDWYGIIANGRASSKPDYKEEAQVTLTLFWEAAMGNTALPLTRMHINLLASSI